MDDNMKYQHSFSNVLNFTREMYDAIDEIILSSNNEVYIDITSKLIRSMPKNDVDFRNPTEDCALSYFKFGANLGYAGLMPGIIDMLMSNSYDVILENYKGTRDIEVIRLQLLFVRKAIKYLCVNDFLQFKILCNQLISAPAEYKMDKYYKILDECIKIQESRQR